MIPYLTHVEYFYESMDKSLKPLLSPKYWPFWPIVGLLRLLVLLPFNLQLKMGRGLGRAILAFGGRIKNTAATNIELCFPSLSLAERQKLLRESFESIGIAIFETATGWWGNDKKLRNIPTRLVGEEHLVAALQKGKGAILCSPHFTSLELVGRLYALQKPFAVMYRPQKNPLIEYITRRALDKHYVDVVTRNETRKMLKLLNENNIVWYAPDIDAGVRNSVFVPYFGVLAASITATPRYAQLSGAPIVFGFFYRQDDGSYDFVIKPLENYPSGELEKDVTRINQEFEKAILVKPAQYLWQYKRFKTRPAGEKRFYGNR